MADLATLQVNIEGAGVDEMTAKLNRLADAGARAEGSAGTVSGAVNNTAAAARAGAAAVGGFGDANLRAAESATHHSITLGRVERSFESFIVQTTGANEQLALLAAAFGHLEIGAVSMIGVLGGAFGVIKLYELVTHSAREATKAAEEFAASPAGRLAASTGLGLAGQTLGGIGTEAPGRGLGSFNPDIPALTKDANDASKAIDALGGKLANLTQGGLFGQSGPIRQLATGLLEGQVDATGLAQGIQAIPDAIKASYPNAIRQLSDFGAQFLAAKDHVTDLTGAILEQQAALRFYQEKFGVSSIAQGGAIQGAQQQQQVTGAFISGGPDALHQAQDMVTALNDAKKIWDSIPASQKSVTEQGKAFEVAVKDSSSAAYQLLQTETSRVASARQLAQAEEAVALAQRTYATGAGAEALVKAAENQFNLAVATNATKLADQDAANAVRLKFDAIANGLPTLTNAAALTADAMNADAAAASAARDHATELAHLKNAQDTDVQQTAALVAYKTALIGADAAQAAAAKQQYDATTASITQQAAFRDAIIDATAAVNGAADADNRATASTAFHDRLAGNIDALNRETVLLLAEATAKRQGQAEADALTVHLAGEAEARRVVTDGVRAHVAVTQAEIDAARQAAEAHEKATIALTHATQEEKEFANVSKNFVHTLQSDVGTFFEGIFTDGIGAATKFWQSFEQLALKTFGELAAKDLIQTVIAGSHGQGVLGGLLGGIGGSGGPSSTNVPQQYGPGGIPLAPGSGVQPLGGGFSIGTFSLAAAGVVGVASALNSLIGATQKTPDEINKIIESIIALRQAITSYATAGAPSVLASLAQNASAANQLRQQAETDLAGKKLQAERERDLSAIGAAETQNAQRIVQNFFAGLTEQLNALNGPAGNYQNSLDALNKEYADNVAVIEATFGGQDKLNQATELYQKKLDALNAAYAEAAKQLQFSLDAREAYAKGLTAEGDAIARRAQEDKELFDAQQAGYTDAQIAQLKYIQGLEDEAALKKQLADANNALAQNLAGGPGGTAASALAASLAPLLQKQAADQEAYNQAVIDGLDPMTQLALQVTLAADAAEIAATAFQATVAALQQSTTDIENAVSGGFITGASGLAGERANLGTLFGIDPSTITDALLKSFYTDPTQAGGLTNQQRAQNAAIDQFFKDEAQWGPQMATAAAALASPSSAAGSAASQAITSGARALTDQVGNRMADYLATLVIRTTEIRDDNRNSRNNAYGGSGVTVIVQVPPGANQNDVAAGKRIAKTVDEALGSLKINTDRSRGVNTIGGTGSLIGT
jgi:hypothetical protein